MAFLLMIYVSQYFGILLSLWFGAASIAILSNVAILHSNIKEHNRRVKEMQGIQKGFEDMRRMGLVEKPRSDEPPIFIGETTDEPNRYLWWVCWKGGL